jgi:probable rRNA maturation factor
MTIFIEIAPEFQNSPDLPNFHKCILATLDAQGVSIEYDLSLAIDNDERIRELNYEFLGQDKPTDVLAFPAQHVDPDSGNPYLGDVIVSFPRAQAQAEKAGHTVTAELYLLTIHGILHLLGHDHDQPEKKARMWHAQKQVLAELGVQVNLADIEVQSER